ncbi:MAG: biotin--[acetyl-CoA-carboxylase] ligase [Sulfurimonas sp. RIFOXYD12_FULL_33_39]|uniref:biotin--[acetyl-CoA-carboxylase] ligase n=1 Tax=unclassified Sulfurimonas TaxID=2623549 RepID=UPI0008D603DB|nr:MULTISPECIES: biotin--[acetyl-CoA-carboxylase] ligase [unclassified Sulfurimonas]OHE02212.1 MAG: biotin--[acetyl-CoA-carboxylase] ligase [Sulfurimonas sp. RIFCSPLOWO2_12_FULL_34_6]OHE10139.1 MAG: biotin--[acetyl-CoA-carboxylase] ligase [Sulfurimonas sp. RIFOXYD12_FULL_33_39]OHE14640.1 MAG: biotin--[acetyl-CoA-carboxylase] ligase [Sulfurimonas sp. RIFOXYD2_FULL_34_21]
MQILYLESIGSTQKYLKELVAQNKISLPYAVVAYSQTDGVGSRENSWSGMDGNLFLSFAIKIEDLPHDLKLESASIYFSYILKETLEGFNSKVWLKWPNDFYINNLKVGGVIINMVKDTLVCGIGLNTTNAPENFQKLDIVINRNKLLETYFMNIEKKSSWKQVFSKYKLEFYKNQNFYTHDKNLIISLNDASLQSDGSILINGERIYSRR